MNVVSPVSGIVVGIDKDKYKIYIRGPYDEKIDDHHIYAPLDGKISDILLINMKPFRRIIFKTVDQLKKGRLYISIGIAYIMIEVGHGYVSDQINLNINLNSIVSRGQNIGEIIVKPHNSYAEVYLPNSQSLVFIGSELHGGQTILATISKYYLTL